MAMEIDEAVIRVDNHAEIDEAACATPTARACSRA